MFYRLETNGYFSVRAQQVNCSLALFAYAMFSMYNNFKDNLITSRVSVQACVNA